MGIRLYMYSFKQTWLTSLQGSAIGNIAEKTNNIMIKTENTENYTDRAIDTKYELV